MKKLLLYFSIALSCGLSFNTNAQDVHFSQFYNLNTFNNVALAGDIKTNYRATLAYKEQFSQFINGYKTFYFAFDMPVFKDIYDKKTTGIGIQAFQDEAGDSKTRLTNIYLNISQTVTLSQFSSLSLGLGFGYQQRTANYNNLLWDSQFDGFSGNPNLPSNENISNPNDGNIDLLGGITYVSQTSDNLPLTVGLQVSHINRPSTEVFTEDKLPIKYLLVADKKFNVSVDKRLKVQPAVMFAQQSAAREVVVGAMFHYISGLHSKYTDYFKNSIISFGLFSRVGDAIIPTAMYSYREKYTLGISYDITYSNLSNAAIQGGLEISFVLNGSWEPKYEIESPVNF